MGLDIRMVPGLTYEEVMDQLAGLGGSDVTFEKMGYSPPVYTEPDDPWYGEVCNVMADVTGEKHAPAIATYFTDAEALVRGYGHPPTVILGPGEPEMAHQTDEYCHIHRIEQAHTAFAEIVRRWCGI